jgi:hypothetical protein
MLHNECVEKFRFRSTCFHQMVLSNNESIVCDMRLVEIIALFLCDVYIEN